MTGTLPALEHLGTRISIHGPVGAGKSTLAQALGRATGIPPIHLDQLHHVPGTDWQPRQPEEFENLHADAIAAPAWIMDGNYSRLMPPRLARATAIIWIDLPVAICAARYFKRCMLSADVRTGGLAGGSERFKWHMLHHLLVVQPRSKPKLDRLIAASGKPVVKLENRADVRGAYVVWGLTPAG